MQTYIRVWLTAVAVVAATLLPIPASAGPHSLDQAVTEAMIARTGLSVSAAATQGRGYRLEVQRSSGEWRFGVATMRAPFKEGEYPQAWLFLAVQEAREWTVSLDNSQAFLDLGRRAPAAVFSASELATFESSFHTLALSNNTGLRLPYAVGASWTMSGGPHGWGGSDTPWSSLDLHGGDGIVRAAGAGNVYTMCADNSNGGTPGGWRRVYHSNGYTTDYYHLWNLASVGSTVTAGQALGNIGKNLCQGGAASGPHVHWGILQNTTRVAWHWRSAGKWVFWNGGAPYGGYALHGSAQANVGGALYNYGALGTNQGIVDANGGGTVNKRSGPGTGYGVVGSVADGTTITISCWRNGTSHSGRWGTTAVWNKLTDGTWVSDAFAYTGVNTIGPNC